MGIFDLFKKKKEEIQETPNQEVQDSTWHSC